jgi:hypothetical protein
MDWGERRMHLAGRVGVLLCAHCVQQGWLLRVPKSRALQLSPAGAVAFRDWLGVKRWNAISEVAEQARFSRTG